MNTEQLELAACRVVLGTILSDELVAVAVRAIQDGCESPSLILLAGWTSRDVDGPRELFDRAMAEVGRCFPSKWASVMRLAREEARAILDGRTSSFAGARRIWDLTSLADEERTHELDTFIYGASEWEGRPDDAAIFEQGILEAARELAGG